MPENEEVAEATGSGRRNLPSVPRPDTPPAFQIGAGAAILVLGATLVGFGGAGLAVVGTAVLVVGSVVTGVGVVAAGVRLGIEWADYDRATRDR
jgi:hypothetical protein